MVIHREVRTISRMTPGADERLPRSVTWLLALSILSLLTTVPHAFEDFAADELARFDLHLEVLQFGLGVAFLVAMQAAAIALSARRQPAGYLLSAALGAFWFVGAGVLHVPQLLGGPFRAGLPSIALIMAIMGANLAVLAAAIAAFAGSRAVPPRPHRP